MDNSKIVLRFRNYVNKALGTEEHTKIIDETGSAFWGWWGRSDEPTPFDTLNSLGDPFNAVLISPSEEVQFSAAVKRIHIGSPPDEKKVPAYYRDLLEKIDVWFEITRISTVDFDKHLSDLISNVSRTLFTIDEIKSGNLNQQRHIRTIKSPSNMLLHISDVHLGSEHNFLFPGEKPNPTPEHTTRKLVTLAQAIKDDLNELKVSGLSAIVVSGDLVSQSKWDHDLVLNFFKDLAESLNVPKGNILFVPGNHDFYRQDEDPEKFKTIKYEHEMSYRGFISEFHDIKPLHEINQVIRISIDNHPYDIILGLLNSARWTSVPGFYEFGFVGKEKYKSVLDNIRSAGGGRPSVRALVLHHHLLPIQPFERPGMNPLRPISVTLDAVEILNDAQEADVALVLHGHQHKPDLIKISRHYRQPKSEYVALNKDIFLCAAGSCGSKELSQHDRNTYSLFQFGSDSIEIRIRTLDPEHSRGTNAIVATLPLRLSK